MFENIIKNKTGKKVILLGNEAIVRGALEEGVDFVSTYPGTPSSEIGNIFFKLSKDKKYKGYFEFSTNEKVALEAGIGASYSGLKTLVAMKNFGANVALDALAPFVYTGAKGPTVIIVADDPSCHSSAQSEENSRGLAYLAHIPILEPSHVAECRDMVKLAFRLSQKFKMPIMVRTTTRVAHQRAVVSLGRLKSASNKGFFKKDKRMFVTLPPRVMQMKEELLEKIKQMQKEIERLEVNKLLFKDSSARAGVVVSGVSYLYLEEALKELGLRLPVLKINSFYPLPENQIKKFIAGLDKLLVLEELEPYLEKEIAILSKEKNCRLSISGKNLLPQTGELRPEMVLQALAKFVGKKSIPIKPLSARLSRLEISKRKPRLCPGCPYWLVVSAVKKAVKPDIIFGGEIGCYMLFGMPSINMQDYLSCMGSSVGIAHGIKKSSKQKLIAFVGDSSFFHSGIPALINAVYNRSNPLIIILENETTAMTGHQPHPGIANIPDNIKIERLVKACGVKHLKVIDPIEQKEFIETVRTFLKKPEVSVIISRRPCIQIKK